MSQIVPAIFKNGLFRPLAPVMLAEHDAVSLIVQSEGVAASTNVETSPANADFDEQLSGLLFDGPSLPADFSRADIYAEHD